MRAHAAYRTQAALHHSRRTVIKATRGADSRNHPALARQQQSHHRSLRLNSYHRPVVGGPAPCDRDDFRQYRCDVGPAERAELLRKPVPEPLYGHGARFDEQLAVRIAAEVKSEEIEPFREGDDPGLGFVERQPSRLQPPGQPRLDLLGLLPGVAAYDQDISISSERRTRSEER